RPDAKRIVPGGGKRDNPGEVTVWDSVTQRKRLHFTQHQGPVRALAFSPDGKRVLSGGDRTVKGWDARTGDVLFTLRHQGQVIDIVVSSDGRRIVSGSEDNTIKVWDARTGENLHTLGHEQGVTCVAISPDGKYIASGGHDRTVRVWDA